MVQYAHMELEAMQKAIIPIVKRHGLALVVLFGSAARGKINKFSDMDIAIRPKQAISYRKLAEIEYEFCEALKRKDVELMNLRDIIPPLLMKFIAQDGKVLYEEVSGLFDEFQMYAMHAYAEAQSLLKLGEKQLRERIAAYAQ